MKELFPLSDGRAVNVRDSILPALPGQSEFVQKLLSGSQAKTAFAIRLNAERMIREDGVNCVGFLTLTAGDYVCGFHGKQIPEFKNHCPECRCPMDFVGIKSAAECNRRFNNLNRRLLGLIFKRGVVVTERHASMNLHFHLLGSLASGADIRTGLNFDELKQRNYSSASVELKALWKLLREKLPEFGFGRHELLPVKTCGEAVAAYVSKYIEKNVCNRTPDDKRKKLVRYIGWEKQQLKPNEFEWDGERARAWRAKSGQLFRMAGCELRDAEINPPKRIIQDCASAAGKIRPKQLDGSEIRKKFGARWAMVGTGIWCEVFGDDKLPYLEKTPNRVLECQEKLWRAERRFSGEVVGGIRVIRNELFNRLLAQGGDLAEVDFSIMWDRSDADENRRNVWAMEFDAEISAGAIELPDDYFTGNFANN